MLRQRQSAIAATWRGGQTMTGGVRAASVTHLERYPRTGEDLAHAAATLRAGAGVTTGSTLAGR